MRKRVATAAAVMVATVLGLSSQAGAIPIHHHVTVHKTMLVPYHDRAGKRRVTVTVHRTEKYDVAPAYVPPTPTTVAASSTTAAPSTGGCSGITPYSGGGQCWAVPYGIVACESGGSLTAQNSSSGAYGAYQLLGHGEYAGMPKSEQDAMAADLYAGGAGASNWVCTG